MRKLFVMTMAALCICSMAFAGDEAKATKMQANKWAVEQPMKAMPLNNVIKMDADGKRTALCCCGAEFTVTSNAPTVERPPTTFYMCGEGCKEMTLKASKEEEAKTMAAWNAKYSTYTLASNTKTWAKCGCGKEFDVTPTSLVVSENGMKIYCCSEACHTAFKLKSADDRQSAQLSALKSSMKAEQKKNVKEAVGTR